MQTYSSESVPSQWPVLLSRVTKGEEILITEKERLVARIIPIDSESMLLRELEALQQASRKSLTSVLGENSELAPVTAEDYPSRIRALRGFVPGINTDIENEDDPA